MPAPVARTEPLRAPDRLGDILERAGRLPPSPTFEELHFATQLEELAYRLVEGRFQVAVVGQFKRGKSSLLNALLGTPLLPVGVIPLTALPTHITPTEHLALEVRFATGSNQTARFETVDALRAKLAEFVDEQKNPGNAKGVERIEVFAPAPRVPPGLVFVDTPGVGSTHSHNTDAAHAALVACDAALFVVSPDPPITEVELSYLRTVEAHAAETIVVLNKADGLEGDDLATALRFLREVLEAHGAPCEVLPVSAKLAAAVQRLGDADENRRSGLATLEAKIGDLAARRGALLDRAVAQKAHTAIDQLALANDLALAGLTTPLALLDERLAAFARSSAAFGDERRATSDQLAGDRKRLLGALDEQAEQLRGQLEAALGAELEQAAAHVDPERAWDDLKGRLPADFDRLFSAVVAAQQAALEAAIERHRKRADKLLSDLRREAAALLEIPFYAPASEGALELRNLPAWSQRPREALADVPTAAVVSLLPAPLRRRALLARSRRELEELVRRNVEALRWSTRQNIEASLNKYQRDLDEALKRGLAATTDSILAARDRRLSDANAAAAELAAREARQADLAACGRVLAERCDPLA